MTRTPITILSNERDFAADDVINHLLAMDEEVSRLNIETARAAPVESWSPGTEDDRAPSVVWWRQFEAEAHPSSVDGVDEVLVERAQWRSWLSVLDRPGSTWVNGLWEARRAENKIEQLRMAAHLGFTVPPTLITNDPAEAMRFSGAAGDGIVKSLASAYFSFSDQSFVFTEALDHPALADTDAWRSVPLVIQQRLRGALDARVISFGNATFGARCQAAGLDWRKSPYDPHLWDKWDVPPALATLCRSYRLMFGLEYAAFDFMIDTKAVYFLEANQAGEWMFIDRALDLGISRAFACHLVSLGSHVA